MTQSPGELSGNPGELDRSPDQVSEAVERVISPLRRKPMAAVASLDGSVKMPLICLSATERDAILSHLSRQDAERAADREALKELCSAAAFVFNRITNGVTPTRKELTDKLRGPVDNAQANLYRLQGPTP